jgi:hypothetical protein
MYYSELTSKPLSKVMRVKQRGVDATFDGSTTYFGNYRQWSRGQTQIARSQSSYEPLNMPFEGLSICKNKKKTRFLCLFLLLNFP